MGFIKALSSLDRKSVAIAGGKGSSLGEMIKAGIPVPPGFVLLSTAFDYFLEKSDLKVEIDSILHSVDINKMHTVENASEKINALILDSETPEEINNEIKQSFKKLDAPFVAVRSSATSEDSAAAAWAGQLDTYLNTTEENILVNIKKCWASLFTPRAIFYRFHKDLHKDNISVAVIVQKMIESEVSGIAFSVHPVTQDRNHLIIEAGFGLGEAIVSGQITPDSYVVEKKDWLILDKNINIQKKALVKASDGGNRWKELPEDAGNKQALSDKEIIELSKLIINIENHYDFPVDVEWAKEKGKFYITQSRPITTLENIPPINHNPIKKEIVLGNQDIDTSMIALEMTWVGMRDKRIKQQVGIMLPELYCEIIKGRTINGYVNPEELRSFVDSCSKTLFENKQLILDIKESTKRICKDMIEYANENKALIKTLKLEEIPKVLNEIRNMQAECASWGLVVAFADIFGTITNKSIDILERRKNLEQSTHIYSHVLSGPSEKSLTEKAMEDIRKCSNKEKMLECYFWLNQGYIGKGLSLNEINEIKEEEENKEKKIISKEDAVRELRLTKEELYNFDLLSDMAYVKSLRADCRQFLNVLLNRIIDRLAEAWGIKDIYIKTLTIKDICEIIEQRIDIPSDLESRYAHSLFIQKDSEDYEIICGDNVKRFLDEKLIKKSKKEKKELKGNIAYIGKAKGHVKLVFGAQHNSKVKKGDILVSTATSPQLLPAMTKAAAFITDIGGITSHAAIVARELKKPCIIGTKIATQVFKDGDLVEVDAEKGVVRILKTKWFAVSSRGKPHAILVIDSVGLGIKKDYARKILNINYQIRNYRQFDNKRAIDMEDYNNIVAFLEKSLKKEPKTFYKIGIKIEDISTKITGWTDKLKNSDWHNLENSKLYEYLDLMTDLQSKLWAGGLGYSYYFYFNDILIERFITKLKNKITNFDNKLLRYITSPENLTFIGRERLDLLSLAKDYFKEKRIDEIRLKMHWEKYAFLKRYYFLGSGFSFNEIKKRFNEIIKKGEGYVNLEIKKIQPLSIDLEKYNLDNYEKHIIKSARKASYAFNLSDEVTNYYIHNLMGMFIEIAQRLDITYEQLVSMKLDEIKASLFGNILKIPKKELDFRLKEHAFIYSGDSSEVLTGKKLKEYKKNEIPENIDTRTDSLKGTVAVKYEKILRGRVRVIQSCEEIGKFKRDEVLVTTMTNPAYVPIMEKSIAIITDEGGLLCHAAIVSRELNKPCIIGTKIATQVFKDGDLVEVDAESGVVKILERNKK